MVKTSPSLLINSDLEHGEVYKTVGDGLDTQTDGETTDRQPERDHRHTRQGFSYLLDRGASPQGLVQADERVNDSDIH